MSQLSEQLVTGVCALTRLNVDACASAVTGAALHWESVFSAQTPEQFVRRQADVMPWLALQFAAYTRGWMDIASETARPRHSACTHGGTHEPQPGTMPAGVSACAAGGDAMMREAVPLQANDESVAEPHAREMVRAILARVAKAGS
jgi:hypothetical protein